MKRQIKFRVWNVAKSEWMNAIEYSNLIDRNQVNCPDFYVDNGGQKSFHVCQFTGLKDKNGKEIYEGDILISTIDKPHFTPEYQEVIFLDGSFQVQYASRKWADVFCANLDERTARNLGLKIIGNRFVNSDLLAELDSRLRKAKKNKCQIRTKTISHW